jgi:fucose 4-O-acetylase-like acetyltransferase
MDDFVNRRVTITDYLSVFYSPYDIYWFLYVLFLFFAVYYLLSTVFSEKIQLILAVGLYLVQINCTLFFLADLFMRYFIFFVSGSLFYPYINALLSRIKNRSVWVAVVLLGGLLLSTDYFSVRDLTKGILFDENPKAYYLIIASAGIMLTFFISGLLSKTGLLGFLIYLGKNSLFVYVSHNTFTSGTRIFLIKALSLENIAIHVIVELVAGVLGSLLLYRLSVRCKIKFLYRI